jgi:uncharacterized protein YutE (UPF0331/DUF86 family)
MVDRELIRRKIIFLEQNKAGLKKLGVRTFVKFKADYSKQKAAEKILQEMIETCLDIGKHIISDERFRSPEEYRDVFTILEEEKILHRKTAEIMRHMVGFRNVIIHLYEKIDIEVVFAAATKRLADFDIFVKEILKFMRQTRK